MFLSPTADVATGPIILVSLMLGLTVLLVIVLIETAVLRRIGWATWWRSLVHALAMNLVSAVVGVLLAGWLANDGELLFLLLALLASIIIEGLILLALKGENSAGRAWRASALANIASYIVVGLFIVITA